MFISMKRMAFFVFLTLFLPFKNNAQIDLQHSVYAELAGSAGIYSINYDLIAFKFNDLKLGARAGLSFLSEGYEGSSVDLHLPITLNLMYTFKERHHAELGIGTQIASYEIRKINSAEDVGFTRKTEALGNYTLGYRYQQPEGGFMFRVFYSPFFYQDGIYFRYEHWAGLSIGYTFKKKISK